MIPRWLTKGMKWLLAFIVAEGLGSVICSRPIWATVTYNWTNTVGSATAGEIVKGYNITNDSDDNAYSTGYVYGTVDFDPTAGEDIHIIEVDSFFVTKTNSNGSYGWTRTIELADGGDFTAMTASSSGSLLLTGYFSGTVDFDPTAGEDIHEGVGGNNVFISEYNQNGSYGWTKTFGNNLETGNSITVDKDGNIYVVGGFFGDETNTVDFDPGLETDNHTSNGISDIFISKYAPDGSYAWTKTLGGEASDWPHSVATDSDGNIYFAGVFNSPSIDFDPDPVGENTITCKNSIFCSFVSKYNQDGSYGWTKTFDGDAGDSGGNSAIYSLTVYGTNHVYVGGKFDQAIDFNPGGTDEHTAHGSEDAFITKYDGNGAYQWTKTFGGDDNDFVSTIKTDTDGRIYLSGGFHYIDEVTPVDFDPSEGTDNHTPIGGYDIFISRYASDGSYDWTSTMGGLGDQIRWPGTDQTGNAMALDSTTGNLYLSAFFGDGGTETVDFDPTGGTNSKTSLGDSANLFVSQYSQDDYAQPTATPTTTPAVADTGATATSSNASSPVCNDIKPSNNPNLFQIDANNNQATLYFAPVNNNITGYYIAYSEKPNTFQHGIQINQGKSTGVLSYTINHLKPLTVYYFMVRGQNGCMPGDWSNVMKITTKVKRFLKNTKPVTASVQGESVTQTLTQPVPTSLPVQNDTINPPKPKKHCFLWWC